MSAQSKAMYWQARAMELEAMVERMAEALNFGCGCPHHQRFRNHFCPCEQNLSNVVQAYAAMKGGK